MRGGRMGELTEQRRQRCVEAIIKKIGQPAWDRMKPEQQEAVILQINRTLKDKYNNVKTTVDGIQFDSKKEAADYMYDLKQQLAQGKIRDLKLQEKFLIQEGFYHELNKEKIQDVHYIPDFVFFAVDYISYRYSQYKGVRKRIAIPLKNVWVVRDTKGMKTDKYQLKRKLFMKLYPNYFFEET